MPTRAVLGDGFHGTVFRQGLRFSRAAGLEQHSAGVEPESGHVRADLVLGGDGFGAGAVVRLAERTASILNRPSRSVSPVPPRMAIAPMSQGQPASSPRSGARSCTPRRSMNPPSLSPCLCQETGVTRVTRPFTMGPSPLTRAAAARAHARAPEPARLDGRCPTDRDRPPPPPSAGTVIARGGRGRP